MTDYKKLRSLKIEREPNNKWNPTVLMIVIISGVLSIIFVATELLINFKGCWS